MRSVMTILGDMQHKSWFYTGMAFWGIFLALIRGWSLAIAHLIFIYVVLGWFVLSFDETHGTEATSSQMGDLLNQFAATFKNRQPELVLSTFN